MRVLTPVARLGSFINGYPFTGSEFSADGVPVVRIRQLLNADADVDRFNGTLHPRYRIDTGDLIFSWSGTLAVRIWTRGKAVLNQHLFRVEPSPGVDKAYLRWALDHAIEELAEYSHGSAMSHITQNALKTVGVVKVDQGAQRQIAAYLDRETGQIDELIAKQEQLLTTLAERRQGVITRAITEGISAETDRRKTEVAWLKSMPSHWVVRRVKDAVLTTKGGVWGSDPEGARGDLRCVRVADFDRARRRIHDRDVTLRSVALSERKGRVLQRGDLLLEKSGGGERNPVGVVVLYDRDEPAVCSNFVNRVVLRKQQHAEFWVYAHRVLYARGISARSIKQTSGIQNLDQQSYFDELIGYPPFEEQRAIAAYLDEQTAAIDTLSTKTTQMISLLRERRQALISAAVTGKIDVRSA